jgi:hypothetical protein
LLSQVREHGVGQSTRILLEVWNSGEAPSWSCHVELYQGPDPYGHPLADYALRGSERLTLHPGERRQVAVPWTRLGGGPGQILALIYDPLLDPLDFEAVIHAEPHSRHMLVSIFMDQGFTSFLQ